MRRSSHSPQPFRKPLVSELPAGSPRPGGRVAQPPPSPWGARAVRFPCGHMDSEALLAGNLRERKNGVWVRKRRAVAAYRHVRHCLTVVIELADDLRPRPRQRLASTTRDVDAQLSKP